MKNEGKGAANGMTHKQFDIFKNIPTIETDRLRLRKIVMTDLDDVYEYASRPLVSEYLLWEPHPSVEHTKEYLRAIKKEYSKKRFYDWAIALKESNKMIGTCGFTTIRFEENTADVGYVLSDLYWKNGYASEAMTEVLKYGFYTLNLDSLSARIMSENSASIHLAEKMHFAPDYTKTEKVQIKGRYATVLTYVLSKSSYFSNFVIC